MKQRRLQTNFKENTKITAFFTKRNSSNNVSNNLVQKFLKKELKKEDKEEKDVISESSRSDKSHKTHISISSSSTAPITVSSSSSELDPDTTNSSIQFIRANPPKVIDLSRSPLSSPHEYLPRDAHPFVSQMSTTSTKDNPGSVSATSGRPSAKSFGLGELTRSIPLTPLDRNKFDPDNIAVSRHSSPTQQFRIFPAIPAQLPTLTSDLSMKFQDSEIASQNPAVVPSSQNSEDSAHSLRFDAPAVSSSAVVAKVSSWLKSPDVGSFNPLLTPSEKSSGCPKRRRLNSIDSPITAAHHLHSSSSLILPSSPLTPPASSQKSSSSNNNSLHPATSNKQLSAKERIARLKSQVLNLSDTSSESDSPQNAVPPEFDSTSEDEQFILGRLNFGTKGKKRESSSRDSQRPAKQRRVTFVNTSISSEPENQRQNSLDFLDDDLSVILRDGSFCQTPSRVSNSATHLDNHIPMITAIGTLANELSSTIQVWSDYEDPCVDSHCDDLFKISTGMPYWFCEAQSNRTEDLRKFVQNVLSGTDSMESTMQFRLLTKLHGSQPIPSSVFSFETVLNAFLSMGFSRDLAKWLSPEIGFFNTDVKEKISELRLTRVVGLMRLASKSHSLVQSSYPKFISLMIFLCLDSRVSSNLLLSCLEALWEFFSGAKDENLAVGVLGILVPWLIEQSLDVQTRTIAILAGGASQSTKVIVRWMCWVALTKKDWEKESFGSHPPLVHILLLFTGESCGDLDFAISAKTRYFDLALRTEILGYLLTDIKGFYYPGQEADIGQLESNSNLSMIIHAMDDLHPKIRDIPSARLERTRARDALQRLSMQLRYQMDAASKINQKTTKSSLNCWLGGKRI